MAQGSPVGRQEGPEDLQTAHDLPPVAIMRTVFKIVRVVLSVLMALGAGIAVYGTRTGFESMGSKNWPSVPGIILVSKVERPPAGGRNDRYAKVIYEYLVAGRKYGGSRVSFRQGSGFVSEDPTRIVAKYPQDSPVKVYYDPTSPKSSVLEPGFEPTSLIPVGIGAFLFMIALMGTRRIRLRERALEQGEPFPAPGIPREPTRPIPSRRPIKIQSPKKKPGRLFPSEKVPTPEMPPPPLPRTTESAKHKLLRYALLAWLGVMLCVVLVRWGWLKF